MEQAAGMGVTVAAGAAEMADFDQLVRQHQQRVFRVLLGLTRDRDAADTLTQECFLRAYQARERFRGECSPGTWLVRIAVNLARDHAKSKRGGFWRRLLGMEPEEGAPPRDIADAQPSAERMLLARERAAAVWSAAEKLSPQQRAVFVLRFGEDLSLDEISAALDLKLGTVKAHLSRALDAVRESVKEQYDRVG